MYNQQLYCYFIAIASITLLIGCSTPKVSTGKYQSIYKHSESELYLSGPVKTARSKMTLYRENDPEFRKEKYPLYITPYYRLNVIGYTGYYKFDRNGILMAYYILTDSLTEPFPAKETKDEKTLLKIRLEVQDTAEIKKKIQFKQNLQPKKFVFNPYRVRYKNLGYNADDMLIEKDSSYKRLAYGYEYVLNGNGTIQQEISKELWDKDLDGVIEKVRDNYTATYSYNDKQQLIRKTYDAIAYLRYEDHNHLDFDTSFPLEEYTYDEAGNLATVTVYSMVKRNGEILKEITYHKEKYFYDENNQLIHKKVNSGHGGGFMNKNWKFYNEFFFTDKQEVAKVVSYESDRKTVYATYYLKYEGHDAYNNWTKCYFYFGDEKEPYAEVNRIIEYYKEEKE